jgi:hypothetical protein
MGKRAKEHRKRVEKRNARIKQMQTSFNNKLQKMLTEKLEQYQKELETNKESENTSNEESTNTDNFIDIVEVKDVEAEINNQ